MSASQTSTLVRGVVITGNIVCTEPVQIFGRVIGDIHASQLAICEGAEVEGNVMAQDLIVQGSFKGTIHANNVKLRGAAVVNGEIYKHSLTIEQDAQFEGVSRRIDKPVEVPKMAAIDAPAQSADVVPFANPAA